MSRTLALGVPVVERTGTRLQVELVQLESEDPEVPVVRKSGTPHLLSQMDSGPTVPLLMGRGTRCLDYAEEE